MAAVVLLVGAACSNDDDSGDAVTTGETATSDVPTGAAATVEDADVVEGSATSESSTSDTVEPVDTEIEAKDVRTRVDGLAGEGVTPVGFTTIEAQIISAEGELCTVCLWLADTADERARGLMGVTDLGDAVGMAFVFDAPTDGRFFMFQTPAPLSIAWFDVLGAFVAATDMEPCLEDDDATCERYAPGGPYTVAVEMLQGELDVVGIGPGSTIELLAGTESPACAAT